MTIYSVSPPGQEPDEQIIRWSIREASFSDGTTSRHLVGFISGTDTGEPPVRSSILMPAA